MMKIKIFFDIKNKNGEKLLKKKQPSAFQEIRRLHRKGPFFSF